MPGARQGAEPVVAHPRAAASFPALFVLLWSTGFIAAKYGLPYAPPFQFLFYRFTLVALLMAAVAWATRATWPATRREYLHIAVVAWLVHGTYLGGVFVALAGGMSAGTTAMLVGLQPVLTVLLAWGFLSERVVPRQWLGLVCGLAGVYLVVRHKIDFAGSLQGLLPCTLALVGISVGTLYQKRYCGQIDWRAGKSSRRSRLGIDGHAARERRADGQAALLERAACFVEREGDEAEVCRREQHLVRLCP